MVYYRTHDSPRTRTKDIDRLRIVHSAISLSWLRAVWLADNSTDARRVTPTQYQYQHVVGDTGRFPEAQIDQITCSAQDRS